MSKGKILGKISKYAFGVFTGYEIHDQLVAKPLLEPTIQQHVFEKKNEEDEPTETEMLLYAIVAILIFVVIFAVVICGIIIAMCKKTSKKIQKAINA